MQQINVTKSSMPSLEEYIEEIRPMWDTHWLTNMGEKHGRLESRLLDYLGVPYISLMSNGHMALELTLQAMELKGEVITTPFTFASTTHAIVRNNLTPVFCDIKPDDMTIDEQQIESLITDKTTAILPVHVYGNICATEKIEKIAEKHNLKVIYDAAHAFGETVNSRNVADFGDASVFSFHATKVFNTIEGGAVCFHDPELGKILYQLKNFGIKNEEVVDGVGANAKMNEFQAAMGICNLRHIEEEIQKRKRADERYRENLSGIKGLRIPDKQPGVVSNYAYFPVIVEGDGDRSRNAVCDSLRKHNIYARKYFYPITSAFQCYDGKFDPYKTPVSLECSEKVLTLPLYAGLSNEDVDAVSALIREIIG